MKPSLLAVISLGLFVDVALAQPVVPSATRTAQRWLDESLEMEVLRRQSPAVAGTIEPHIRVLQHGGYFYTLVDGYGRPVADPALRSVWDQATSYIRRVPIDASQRGLSPRNVLPNEEKQLVEQRLKERGALNEPSRAAAFVDLDEAMMSNRTVQLAFAKASRDGEIAYEGSGYDPKLFTQSLVDEAELNPGAQEFLLVCLDRGIEVVFISNRLFAKVAGDRSEEDLTLDQFRRIAERFDAQASGLCSSTMRSPRPSAACRQATRLRRLAAFLRDQTADNILTKGELERDLLPRDGDPRSRKPTSDKRQRRLAASLGQYDESGAISGPVRDVIAVVGDDLNDFVSLPEFTADNITAARQRSRQLLFEEGYFGNGWFLLPNPAYGSFTKRLVD